MAQVLGTRRLLLAPLTAADTDALHGLWTTPEVRHFLWDGEVIPHERTAAIVAESARLFAVHGFGLWGARLRDGSSLVGFGGYWYFRDPPELALLYGMAAEHWGQGLATELARAVMTYGLTVLGFPEIRASTDVGNQASARVLEKLGLGFERRAVVGGLDRVVRARRMKEERNP